MMIQGKFAAQINITNPENKIKTKNRADTRFLVHQAVISALNTVICL